MRARNLKPSFFKNEILGLINPLARILYIGLWCYCDREGIFEWRPLRIKVEILPYDDIKIDQILNTLVEVGLIKKYSVNEKIYGFIPTFKKHQNPHKSEKPSIYPPFEEKHNLSTNKYDKNPDKFGTRPAESLILNPESLKLNPDYSKPEKKPTKKNLSSKKFDDDSIEIILSNNLYNAILTILPDCNKPDFQKWAIHIDRLIRINNKYPDRIDKVIMWLFNSDHKDAKFWRANILSAKSLREHFDKIAIKMDESNNNVRHAGALEYLKEQGAL